MLRNLLVCWCEFKIVAYELKFPLLDSVSVPAMRSTKQLHQIKLFYLDRRGWGRTRVVVLTVPPGPGPRRTRPGRRRTEWTKDMNPDRFGLPISSIISKQFSLFCSPELPPLNIVTLGFNYLWKGEGRLLTNNYLFR